MVVGRLKGDTQRGLSNSRSVSGSSLQVTPQSPQDTIEGTHEGQLTKGYTLYIGI